MNRWALPVVCVLCVMAVGLGVVVFSEKAQAASAGDGVRALQGVTGYADQHKAVYGKRWGCDGIVPFGPGQGMGNWKDMAGASLPLLVAAIALLLVDLAQKRKRAVRLPA